MASKLIDLTGQKLGRLTIIELSHFEYEGKHKRPYWKCECECGTKKILSSSILRTTRSCGCLRRETARNSRYKGCEYRAKLYDVLRMAKERCYNPDCEFYKNYGARGIAVCDEWMGENGLDNFVEWSMKNGYKPGLTIDRIDNNKGYSPDNCQWKTRKYQSNHKRNNVYVTIDGITKTLAEWCEFYDVPYSRVRARYCGMGWNILDALLTPRYKKPKGV